MTLTRRDLLRLGAAAGVGAAVGLRPSAARAARRAQEAGLVTKPVPSSGERLPVIGIGTRNYRADLRQDDLTRFRETLRRFGALGGKVLDTAPSYGNSESVLGHLLAELGMRDRVFLATKVDREGKEAGIERMRASLEKLRTDRVELMQVHNLRDARTQLETLRAWREEGTFRYIGVTTSSDRQYPALEALLRSEEMDFVQVDYSLGNRSAEERILPLARETETAVLVNLPFGRTRLFQAVGDRPVPEWAAGFDAKSWAQLFLKYVVSHPAVTVAIPGTTRVRHIEDNMAAARGRMPTPEHRRRMERYFDAL